MSGFISNFAVADRLAEAPVMGYAERVGRHFFRSVYSTLFLDD